MSGAGAVGCLTLGFVADRVPVAVMGRLGAVAYQTAGVILIFSRGMWHLYASCVVAGLGSALFWPSVQGQVGREAPKGKNDVTISKFCISWAFGKAVGCFVGGYLFKVLSIQNAIFVVIAVNFVVLLLIPIATRWQDVDRTASDASGGDESAVELIQAKTPKEGAEGSSSPTPNNEDDRRVRTFLPMVYLANWAFYGVIGTLSGLYPQYLRDIGFAMGRIGYEEFFGIWMGTAWMFQTAVFVALAFPFTFWLFNRWILYAVELAVVLATILITVFRVGWALLILAAVYGVCLGFSAESSLAYSLRMSEKAKGVFAGLHEALTELGWLLIPIPAGVFVSATKEARSSYWFCAGVIAAVMVIQEILFWALPALARRRAARQKAMSVQ